MSRRRRGGRHRLRRLAGLVLVVGVAGLALGALTLAGARQFGPATKGLVTSEPLPLGELQELDRPSVVYSRDGALLTTFKAEVNRKPVTLDQVPTLVRDAVLDVEDNNFYRHGGVDIRSVIRAVFSNTSAGAVREGGSTITQQVVKNSFLGSERTIDRKIKEAVLATRLEQVMTKDQILERYLNLIYLGNGAYGIEAAAETYFGKTVGQLGVVEAALLAGMISNPLGYDPITRPDAALQRRNAALDRMVTYGHLAPDLAAALAAVPVPARLFISAPVRQGYFVEGLKQSLLDDPRLGSTPSERYNALFRGGLQIFSTFDPTMQADAERAVAVGHIIPANSLGAVGALAAVDPATGEIRAIVGGPGFETFKYDIATHAPGRQPGSSFKLFTLLAALEAGYGPGSTVDGSGPCAVVGFGSTRAKPVLIQNSEGPGGGTMTIDEATAGSVNCAYERMAATIGLDKVVTMAKRLGLRRNYDQFPSVVIGSEEATPLEMASAYATLAADGVRHAPTYVVRVVDSHGHEIVDGTSPAQRVLTPQVARTATSILRAVLTSGTAAGNELNGRDAAGKTGTTDTYSNAWFVGFTPQLAAAVWMGVPAGNVPMTDVGGRRVFGATYSAPAWKEFMDAALVGQPAVAFPAPDPNQAIPAQSFQLPPKSFIAGSTAAVSAGRSSQSASNRSSGGASSPTTSAASGRLSPPVAARPDPGTIRSSICSHLPPGIHFPGC